MKKSKLKPIEEEIPSDCFNKKKIKKKNCIIFDNKYSVLSKVKIGTISYISMDRVTASTVTLIYIRFPRKYVYCDSAENDGSFLLIRINFF